MNVKQKGKAFPKLKSDKEAEKFLNEADLSVYDFSEFKQMKFEFDAKSARINMRVAASLLDRIKQAASKKQIPYTRFIRQLLEAALSKEM